MRDSPQKLQAFDFRAERLGIQLFEKQGYDVLEHGRGRQHAFREELLELLWRDPMSVVLGWLEVDREVCRYLVKA